MPFVIRIDHGGTHGFQAKAHSTCGKCTDELCPCHAGFVSKFYTDAKYGGRWFAEQLALQWERDFDAALKKNLARAKVSA